MFHNVLLPHTYSYRSRRDMTSVVADFVTDNRDRFAFPVQRTLFRYELQYENRTPAVIKELRHFFYCRYGPMIAFKFNDPLENSSASDGVSAPSGTDQTIALINTKYYLCKTYGTYQRIIKLPVSGSVIIKDGGSVVTGSCTINSTTGEITGYTPSGAFTAGFQFYVPVRFSKEPFSCRPMEPNNISVTIGLAEVLEDLA